MSERIESPGGEPDELERALRRLKPRSSGVSRDRVMFLVGRHDAQKAMRATRSRMWPLATAASWLVTAAVTGLWWDASSEPAGRGLAQNGPTDVHVAAADPSHSEARADSSTEHVSPSTASSADAPARPRPHTAAPTSGHANLFALHVSGEPVRVSIVGWQDWNRLDRAGRRADEIGGDRADGVFSGDPPRAVPPATYARLMKLYLDDRAGSEIEGDLL